MRWLPFRRASSSAETAIPDDPEMLDKLLAHYVVDVSDETIDEICRNLSALPDNRRGSSARKAVRTYDRAALFWPGVGVAFGMLLLGIVIGTAGLPVPLTARDTQPEFSDLMMPQGA